MNREQKMALFTVIVISIALLAAIAAIAILHFVFDFPWSRAFGGFGFFGISGISGLAPVIYKKDKSKITFDERDLLICKRAALAGFGSAFVFTCIACMTPFFVLGIDATISVTWLPLIWLGTGMSHMYFYSLTLLIEYGRANKGVENE